MFHFVQALTIVKEVMEKPFPKLPLPLEVDASIGKTWAECK